MGAPQEGRPVRFGSIPVDGWLAGVGLAVLLFAHRAGLHQARADESARRALDAAIYDPSAASPILGLIVCGIMLLRRRVEIIEAFRLGRPNAIGAVFFLAGGSLLAWWRQIAASQLAMPSLVLLGIGTALLLGGGRLLRRVSPPLLALILAAPIPAPLMHQLVFPMQLATVSLASIALDLLGLSHEVLGDLIVRDGVAFQVVEGCSGLKSTLSLGLAALLYADLTARSTAAKAFLLALAVPIGVLVNAVRVTILVIGEIPTESSEHFAIGILMIVAGVVTLAGIEILIAKARVSPNASIRASDPLVAPAISPRRRIGFRAVAIGLIVTSTAVEAMPHVNRAAPRPAVDIETLPETIEGWTARGLAFDNGFLGSLWFQQRIFRSYERGAESVRVFIGHEDLSRLDGSGYSPKTAIPGPGWNSIGHLPRQAIESTRIHLETASPDLLVARYPGRRTLVVHWRIGYAPWGRYLLQRWLGLDYLASRDERSSPLVIRIETDVHTGDDERAWMILRQFAKRVEEWSILSLDPAKNAQ